MAETNGLPRYIELIRVSSTQQADRDTPEMQRQALLRLREVRPGIRVADPIEELGVSGTLPVEKRPHLLRLINLAAKKQFDELRIYAIDRLTRSDDMRERAMILGALKDANAKIVDRSGTEYDLGAADGMSELIVNILSVLAAKEAIKIRARVTEGKAARAAKGLAATGHIPYARTFDHKANTWGIDEQKAKIAQRMFALCASGHTLSRVAEILNEEGYRSPKSKTWTAKLIQQKVHDTSFIGQWQQCGLGVPVPAIISQDLFEEVQRGLAKRRSYARGPRTVKRAMFSRMLVCGYCGATMHVTGGNGDKCSYMCGSHFREREVSNCPAPKKSLRAKVIDRGLVQQLRSTVCRPELVKELAERLIVERDDRSPALRERLADLQQQLAKVQARKQHFYDMMADTSLDLDPAEIRTQLASLKTREEKLKLDLDGTKEALAEIEASTGSFDALEERSAQTVRLLNSDDATVQRMITAMHRKRGSLRVFHDRIEAEPVLLPLAALEEIAAEPKAAGSHVAKGKGLPRLL